MVTLTHMNIYKVIGGEEKLMKFKGKVNGKADETLWVKIRQVNKFHSIVDKLFENNLPISRNLCKLNKI